MVGWRCRPAAIIPIATVGRHPNYVKIRDAVGAICFYNLSGGSCSNQLHGPRHKEDRNGFG
ncbi:UNVERIFIED_ORG: hypothetical protein ABIB52_004218 [Arthrobacter sp. UYCu721]